MTLIQDAETPSWSPFAEAMERAYQAWQTDDGGDQFIVTMEQAMDAWATYRNHRYGTISATEHGA